LMALGVFLGLSDQSATGTSGGLRVPALVAALLLVAQGFDMLLRTDTVNHRTVLGGAGELHRRNTALGRARTVQARTTAAGRRIESAVACGLLLLAVWLGLATLKYAEAPRFLGSLSLVASFLLFAFGWQVLTDSRKSRR
ncbi:MAG: hypothetical protein QG608_2880, partial [Actinomycetota bacterium]|nr:hypothetical protein [Actinomycetota bacterium]